MIERRCRECGTPESKCKRPFAKSRGLICAPCYGIKRRAKYAELKAKADGNTGRYCRGCGRAERDLEKPFAPFSGCICMICKNIERRTKYAKKTRYIMRPMNKRQRVIKALQAEPQKAALSCRELSELYGVSPRTALTARRAFYAIQNLTRSRQAHGAAADARNRAAGVDSPRADERSENSRLVVDRRDAATASPDHP